MLENKLNFIKKCKARLSAFNPVITELMEIQSNWEFFFTKDEKILLENSFPTQLYVINMNEKIYQLVIEIEKNLFFEFKTIQNDLMMRINFFFAFHFIEKITYIAIMSH